MPTVEVRIASAGLNIEATSGERRVAAAGLMVEATASEGRLAAVGLMVEVYVQTAVTQSLFVQIM